MKILLLGQHGQLGWELQRSLAPLGEVVALGRDAARNPLHQGQPLAGDLCQPQALLHSLRCVQPDLIVNAAAYTAVDQAEAEPELARQVNATAVGLLAAQTARQDAAMVHFSTDYVFDGSGSRPWTEADLPAPCNVYGQTKLQGERLLQQHQPRHLILRAGWLYAPRGHNFACTMLRLGQEREHLQVVADQYGAPTSAELLADVAAHAIRQWWQRPALSGVYHVAAAGATSWHGYACYLLEQARQAGVPLRVARDAIEPLPSSAWPARACRPHNTRLDTGKLQRTFGLHLPPWQAGVQRMLAEWWPTQAHGGGT